MNLITKFAQFRLHKFYQDVQAGRSVSTRQLISVVAKGALTDNPQVNTLEFYRPFLEHLSPEAFQVLAKASPLALRPQLLGWALATASTGSQAQELVAAGAALKAIFPNGYPAWFALTKFSDCGAAFQQLLPHLSVQDFEGTTCQTPNLTTSMYEKMEWLLRYSTPEAFAAIIDQHISANFVLFSDGNWRYERTPAHPHPLSDHDSHSKHTLLQYLVMELVRPDLPPSVKANYEQKLSFLVSRGVLTTNLLGYAHEPLAVISGKSEYAHREHWVTGSPAMIEAVAQADRHTTATDDFLEYLRHPSSSPEKLAPLKFWQMVHKYATHNLNLAGATSVYQPTSLLCTLLRTLQRHDFGPSALEEFKHLFLSHIPASQQAWQASLLLRECKDPSLGQWLWDHGGNLHTTSSYYDCTRLPTSFCLALNNWEFFTQLVKRGVINLNDPTPFAVSIASHGTKELSYWRLPLGVQLMFHLSSAEFAQALDLGLDATRQVAVDSPAPNSTATYAQLLALRCADLGAPQVAGNAERERRPSMLKCADFLATTYQTLSDHHVDLSQNTTAYPFAPLDILRKNFSAASLANRFYLFDRLDSLISQLYTKVEFSHLNATLPPAAEVISSPHSSTPSLEAGLVESDLEELSTPPPVAVVPAVKKRL